MISEAVVSVVVFVGLLVILLALAWSSGKCTADRLGEVRSNEGSWRIEVCGPEGWAPLKISQGRSL